MVKVGIIGCGKIADVHASLIESIPDCEIVGVCDKEELMAKQMYERFNVKYYFSDVYRLLNDAHPDVVHITTPPQSHFELGKLCLEAGCHVYIEKPFTVSTEEAKQLIGIASERGRKVTVGHDDQFTNATRRMRKLIEEGYLGGPPVHMESYYCYDLGDERYARAFLNDNTHWLRSLPGQLMHNVISHGLAKIAEFLEGKNVEVIAHGLTREFLRR